MTVLRGKPIASPQKLYQMAANRHQAKSGAGWRPDPRRRTFAPQRRMALPRGEAVAAG